MIQQFKRHLTGQGFNSPH